MNQQTLLPRRPASYQDVLDAPPHVVAEPVRGALSLQPRPAPRHAVAHSALGAKLAEPFHFGGGGAGGWWILTEPELHLGEDVLAPELGGWRRERTPTAPETAFFPLAPDWVCEVLSPGTRRFDLTDKRAIYAEVGVPHLWLVDALARTLEAFVLDAGSWRLIAALRDAAEVRVPPFGAVAYGLDALRAD